MKIDQPERLSVIIPTLNEANRLNHLLDALQAQTRSVDEVIVADAGSKDDTRLIAAQRGAIVVEGGLPGVGRNAGANAASGDIYFFFDADVIPEPGFIQKALTEFNRYQLGIATTLIDALEEDPSTHVIAEATNLYLLIVQHIVPHAPGFCIITRREIHHAIGGFDQTAKMAEDHDYVQRASRRGKFGVLSGVRIAVSMRRLEKEGLAKLALKYLWAEMHTMAGKPVYSMPFDYDFGTHGQIPSVQRKRWKILDITGLRQQMAELENPLLRLSSTGRYQMERLIHWESSFRLRSRVRLALNLAELGKLQRYVSRRVTFVMQNPPSETTAPDSTANSEAENPPAGPPVDDAQKSGGRGEE